MTREQAKEIARETARKRKPSYYVEPFEPHDWVVDAIKQAYDVGYDDGHDDGKVEGYDEGYDDGVQESKRV